MIHLLFFNFVFVVCVFFLLLPLYFVKCKSFTSGLHLALVVNTDIFKPISTIYCILTSKILSAGANWLFVDDNGVDQNVDDFVVVVDCSIDLCIVDRCIVDLCIVGLCTDFRIGLGIDVVVAVVVDDAAHVGGRAAAADGANALVNGGTVVFHHVEPLS